MLVEVRCKTGKEKSFRPSASNHINLLPGPESALHIWLCAKRETFVISLNVKRIHFFCPFPSTPCTLSSTLFPMNIGTTTRSPCALPLPSFYLPSTAPTGKKCHREKRHQLELSSSSMYFWPARHTDSTPACMLRESFRFRKWRVFRIFNQSERAREQEWEQHSETGQNFRHRRQQRHKPAGTPALILSVTAVSVPCKTEFSFTECRGEPLTCPRSRSHLAPWKVRFCCSGSRGSSLQPGARWVYLGMGTSPSVDGHGIEHD